MLLRAGRVHRSHSQVIDWISDSNFSSEGSDQGAMSSGGARGHGRQGGRKRGRPSNQEALRRQALLEAEAGEGGVEPEGPPPEEQLAVARNVALQGGAAQALPTVPESMLKGFRQPLAATPSHPLAGVVAEYSAALSRENFDYQGSDTYKFATEFWSPRTNVWRSSSLVAQSQASSFSVHRTQRTERRLSAAAELAERRFHCNAHLSLATCGPTIELVAFIEGVRYDEATSLLGVIQSAEDAFLGPGVPMDEVTRALMALLEQEDLKETVPCKVFQTESAWSALLAVCGADVPEEKKFIMLSSECATSPQILQRTTADCILRALATSSIVRPSSVARFRWRMRLVCSDRNASQFAAERMLLRERGPGWHRLHLGCEVHMSTAGQVKGLGLFDSAISRMIRFSLSLKLGGWMREFRRCLFQEVYETLEVLEGWSSLAAATHRRRCSTMFLSVGSRNRRSQAILSCLPNGDWSLTDRVQVYVPPGRAWDRRAVALLAAKSLCMTMASRNFAIFNRKRWTLNDLAVSQLGILEACHGLLSRTYRRWLVVVGYRGPLGQAVRQADAAAAAGHYRLLPALPAGDTEGVGAHIGAEAEGSGAADGHISEDDHPDGAFVAEPPRQAQSIDDSFAAVNERNRSIGAAWVLSGTPLRDLVLVRVVMEPSMVVLRRQLRMGSDAWAREQERMPLTSGGDTAREYRLLAAARGELDAIFFRHHAQALATPSLYSLIPVAFQTEECNCLAFRMHARVGAEYERLLASKHRRAPFLLFLVTNQRQVAKDLKRIHSQKVCLLDLFTKESMDEFDVESPEGQAVLKCVLAFAHVDTVKIERWHAWWRRVIARLGTQTHRPNVYDVAGRCFAQRVKRREGEAEDWREGGQRDQSGRDDAGDGDGGSHAPEEQARTKTKRGGGGAWRAHVSKRLRAGLSDFKAIAEEYHTRSAEDVASGSHEGAQGTERHRVGLPAFGPTRRQLTLAQVRNEAIAFNQQHALADRSFVEAAEQAIAPVLRVCNAQNVDHMVRVVNKADALLASARAAAEQAMRDRQRDFASGLGKGLAEDMCDIVPSLQTVRSSLYALPLGDASADLRQFRLVPDSQEVARRAVTIDAAPTRKHSVMCNLGVALDGYWCARQRPIYSGHGEDHKEPRAIAETKCHMAGHCLCSEEGRVLYRLRNSILRWMKFLTPRGSPERELLADGHYVFGLRAERKQPCLMRYSTMRRARPMYLTRTRIPSGTSRLSTSAPTRQSSNRWFALRLKLESPCQITRLKSRPSLGLNATRYFACVHKDRSSMC